MIAGNKKAEIAHGIGSLGVECARIAEEHGWWEDSNRNMGEMLMLVVTELSEAFEEYRKGNLFHMVWYETDSDGRQKPEGFLTEIADVMIRLMDFIGHYKSSDRFASILLEKMEFNEGRSYRHGGKTA
jgi:hypothetical protein